MEVFSAQIVIFWQYLLVCTKQQALKIKYNDYSAFLSCVNTCLKTSHYSPNACSTC